MAVTGGDFGGRRDLAVAVRGCWKGVCKGGGYFDKRRNECNNGSAGACPRGEKEKGR